MPSVGYGLIELEFRKGLRISGIGSARLIESELGLGWAAGGARGADEREDIIDASDKGGPSRGSTAPGVAPSDEPAAD